jgi:hypothetical protein
VSVQTGGQGNVEGKLARGNRHPVNALRGSGPGQKDAFDDAMAQVGCSDRRIDRLCITCCSRSSPCLASLVGDPGTLMQCEFYNDNVFHHGSGGCSASHGALFRLEF